MARRGAAVVLLAAAAVSVGTVMAQAAPKPNINEVKKQIDTLQGQAEDATEQYNGSREKLKSVNVMISAATTRVTQQEQAVTAAKLTLGRLAAETYKAGDLQVIKLLLDDDPDSVLAASGLRASLGEQQAEAVDNLVAAQKQLAADRAALTTQQQQLTTETARLGTLKSDIQAKLAAAQQVLSRLDGTQQAALARLSSSSMSPSDLSKLGITAPATGLLQCSNVGIETSSSRARTMLDFACDQIGKPYQWGADGPGSFDCSGLTMAAWAKAGVSLPHNAAMQAREGTAVSQANLQPGDLLFFNGYNHVGIYIGKGLMVHAPHTGDVVRIASARLDGRLIKAVRL